MPLFLQTDKDPDGKAVRVDAGFRAKNGANFVLLTRLPPHYPKPPSFVVELSADPIELRSGQRSQIYHKAYAIQDFSLKEIKFMREAQPGKVSLPLFGSSGYPSVARWLGNPLHKLSDTELAAVVKAERVWKLVGGQR